MGRKKISHFSSEEKTNIVLALLKEDLTLVELSSKYGLTSKTLQNWKRQFLENASIAFDPSKVVSVYKDEISALKHQNDELAKALGKATVERDSAVGKLKRLDLLSKKSLVRSKFPNLSKARQCALLSINRSLIYYKSKELKDCNSAVLKKIDLIYREHPEYGYRYIYNQLQEDGFNVGRDRVLKYMGVLGISAIYPRKKPSISCKDAQHKVHSYLLDKYWINFGKTKRVHVPKSNQVWSGDITYIRTSSGYMYLAAIIDWHSKAILSYKLSNTMDTILVTDTLERALSKYPAPAFFNSDQGSQYTSHKHTDLLKNHNIQISMNGRGRSIDNIVMERFFRTLKYNYIFIKEFKNIKALKEGISSYITKCNYQRFHSSINYQKPMNVYLNHLKMVA